jgi:hypothetical protein
MIRVQMVAKIAVLALCTVIAFWNWVGSDGTEFSFGRVTGVFVRLSLWGSVLFCLSVPLLSRAQRIAIFVSTIAGLMCFPLYLYEIVPLVIQWMWPSDSWSAHASGQFFFDWPAICGLLSLALMALVYFLTSDRRRLARAISVGEAQRNPSSRA